MTALNVGLTFKVNGRYDDKELKAPITTNEFPIESFIQVRVELLLEIESDQDPKDCPPKTTCPKIKIKFPKTMVSSGVIIWSDANRTLILTAGHSCENAPPKPIKLLKQKIKVRTGHGHSSLASIFKIDDKEDLCLLSTEEYLGPAMAYKNKKIPLHTRVHAMASPLGLGSPYAIPVFEGRYFGDVSLKFSTYGIPSAPGSSGGPIFTQDGQLVGIITAVANGFHHFSIATTVKQTSTFLNKNIKLFRTRFDQNTGID